MPITQTANDRDLEHESDDDNAAQSQSNTPIDIVVRKFDLSAAESAPEYFFDNDPFKTHFLNGLSVLFPEGERFFIRSVLAYRDELSDPRLLADVKAFCAQEAQHGLVHDAMNDLAARHGYPMKKIERFNARGIRQLTKQAKTSSFLRRTALALTVCMEHFTAILAYQVLAGDKAQFDGLDPTVKALFEWHAVEETEHKSVAFDVYQATGGGPVALRIAMLFASFFFVFGALFSTFWLLWHDGNIKRWKTYTSGAKFLFGRKHGFFTRPAKDWLAFFKPGFHPWKQHGDLDTGAKLEAVSPYFSAA
ncbi:MAG: metal-dependent hydrolase [Halioglobus sp.]